MENSFNLDLSHIPNETRILLDIMKMENDCHKSFILGHEKMWPNMDWDLFLQLARHHRVYPSIYYKIKKFDEKWVPPYVVKALQQEFQKNTFRMLQLSGEMGQIAKRLAESRIRTLFLKGPILAYELYGDISLRTSSDLDFLIPMDDLEKADRLLLKQGYVKDDYIRTVLKDWKWRHHHLTYFHPEKKTKLEIHWRLNPGPSKEPHFNELWERKRTSSFTSTPVYLLGSADLFLFLISHGARHGWSRLRWLEDIHQIVQQNTHWDKTRRLLRRYQCLHIGGQTLLLASQLLNTQIPSEMKRLTIGNRPRRLAQNALFYVRRMVNLHTEPVPEAVAQYHKHHLFSLMSGRQKLVFILSFLYPYPKDVETLPLPKSLHVLYFPLRPFLLIWRKVRKQALPQGEIK